MKIIIMTQGRSGGTLLYKTLAGYFAPDQLKSQRIDNYLYDEPFGLADSHIASQDQIDHEQNIYNHIVNRDNWVLKLHVNKIYEYNSKLHTDLVRQSDIVVKLRRKSLRDQVISYCVAHVTGEWAFYTAQEVHIPKRLLTREYGIVSEEKIMLDKAVADFTVYYEDIIQSYPRAIVNTITGQDINTLSRQRFQLAKRQNTVITNWDQVNEWLTQLENNS